MILNNPSAINSTSHRPGTVVSSRRPFYRHVGVTTDRVINGLPTVISNSGAGGMVVEESIVQFQNGGDLQVVGYIGSLPQEVVLARARSKIGTRYSLLTWNCEHFVRYAHGLKEESPQLFVAVSLFAFALIVSRL